MDDKKIVKNSFSYKTAVSKKLKIDTKFLTVLFFSSGQADVTVGGKIYRAGYGSLLLVKPNEYCSVLPKASVVSIAGIIPEIISGETLKIVHSIKNKAVVIEDDAIERINDFLSALKYYSDNLAFIKSVDKLFYCLLSEFSNGKSIDGISEKSPLNKALKYIEDNFLTIKKLSDVANFSGVTVNYLCALFKSKTGVSCNRYIKRLKIRYAEELLLSTDLQIREISDKCGYLSFSHFMSDFKEILKMTPNGYKKNYFQ